MAKSLLSEIIIEYQRLIIFTMLVVMILMIMMISVCVIIVAIILYITLK